MSSIASTYNESNASLMSATIGKGMSIGHEYFHERAKSKAWSPGSADSTATSCYFHEKARSKAWSPGSADLKATSRYFQEKANDKACSPGSADFNATSRSMMQCRGKVQGGSAKAETWYPVQVYFSSASNCDLLSDSFAEEIGLDLHQLYGIHAVHGVDGTFGTCQVAANISIQLQVQQGCYASFELPVIVVPKREFCQYREVLLGLPFLTRNYAKISCWDGEMSLALGLLKNVDIKLDSEMDVIPRNVSVTSYFRCTEELRQICEGRTPLSTDHIFDACENPPLLMPEAAKTLDEQFQILLDDLSLDDGDSNELLEKYGFQPAQIEQAGFKSWPGGLMRLPFMRSKSRVSTVDVHLEPSLLIPARTVDGRITAIHIQLHHEEDTGVPRYMWAGIEQSFKLLPVDSDDLEDPLFICPGNKCAEDSIALIEGGLKAYAFAAQLKRQRADLHAWVIGTAGGQFWQSELGLLCAMAGMQPKVVVLYPDAGAVVNPEVLLSYFRSFQVLLDMEVCLAVAWWGQWSKDEHLDADDFLVQGGSVKQMQKISVGTFWGKVPLAIRFMLQASRHAGIIDDVLQRQ